MKLLQLIEKKQKEFINKKNKGRGGNVLAKKDKI